MMDECQHFSIIYSTFHYFDGVLVIMLSANDCVHKDSLGFNVTMTTVNYQSFFYYYLLVLLVKNNLLKENGMDFVL